MDIEKLLNYLERKTADTHELQAVSAIIGLRQRVQELEKERDSAYKIADHYRAERNELLAALKWIDVFAFDAPELRARARMAIASVKEKA